MKRVLLFLATNLAVLMVISFVVNVLGLGRYLEAQGGNLTVLLVIGALFGFGGSFISLAISKWSAKRMMGVKVIASPQGPTEQWLVETVRAQAERVGIDMPEVGIFDSPTPNAFATGANKNKALVAVSTGLLQRMKRQEVEAVLGHEIGHVANGDMVTMALIQGVLNTFVFFLARVVGGFIDNMLSSRNQDDEQQSHAPGMAYILIVWVLDFVFGILASAIAMWFSRHREFRADAAGASLAGTSNMIGALEALKRSQDSEPLPEKMAAFGINGGKPTGLARLLMSHPPLEQRIEALRRSGGLAATA